MDLDLEKLFQCYDCPDGVQLFATEEELLSHKWDMIRTELSREHMGCHICGMRHRTFEGLIRHYQLSHPAKQKLDCPGCGIPFDRLYQLMTHLEADDCPGISADQVKDQRMKKALDAAAAAAAVGYGATNAAELGVFAVGSDLIPPGCYGTYMGLDVRVAEAAGKRHALEGRGQDKEADQEADKMADKTAEARMVERMQRATLDKAARQAAKALAGAAKAAQILQAMDRRPQPPAPVAPAMAAASPFPLHARTALDFRRGDSKLPDLLTDGPPDTALRTGDVWSGQDMLGVDDLPAGGEDEDNDDPDTLLLAALDVGGSDSSGGVEVRTGSRSTQPEAPMVAAAPEPEAEPEPITIPMHPDHPSHPGFDVYRYKNRFTGRFNCPHSMCLRAGKSYKSAGGLMTHLRSDTAHTTLRVQCPSCSRYFTTIQALIQHCESQSARCHLRESEEFPQFLDTLAAGTVSVEGRHADLTIAYGVQESGVRALLDEE